MGFTPSMLKQVFLEYSSINVRSAETLIRACRHLEFFTFISGGTYSGPERFTCSEIKEILMLQARSLTHLYLGMDEEWVRTFDPGWIGSLVDFSGLKRLGVGRKCLIGTPETGLSLCNVLPSPIQTLRLEYVNQHIISHLVRLATVYQTQFNNLWAVASWTRHPMRLTYSWGFVSQLNSLKLAHSITGSGHKGFLR